MMSSLDLSAGFDVVNDQLLKRLKIIGIPKGIVDLIKIWLTQRQYFVNINGKCSMYFNLESGTIQGSILGPFLYAIYVSPLFDITKLTSFADDNQIVRWNACLNTPKEEMSTSLSTIIKWLKESGLKVNSSKTKICIFHKHSSIISNVKVEGVMVKTNDSINVLVSNTIKRSFRSLHALKKKYFTKKRAKHVDNFKLLLHSLLQF